MNKLKIILLITIFGCEKCPNTDSNLRVDIQVVKKSDLKSYLVFEIINESEKDLIIPELYSPLYHCIILDSTNLELDNLKIIESILYNGNSDFMLENSSYAHDRLISRASNELIDKFYQKHGDVNSKDTLFVNEKIRSWTYFCLFLPAGESYRVEYEFDEWTNRGASYLKFNWKPENKYNLYFADDFPYDFKIRNQVIGFSLQDNSICSEVFF